MKKRSTQWFKLLFAGFVALTFLVTGCSRGGDTPFWFLPEPEPGPSDRVVRMTLLQTTDMHDTVSGVGSFNDYTPDSTGDDAVQGGWARLATKINEIRAARLSSGALVLLVDSGDYNMGTAYDMLWNTDPAPFRFINTMRYDFITLGNHEFDYGPEKLAVMINKAIEAGGFSIPIIATNTVFDGISETADDDLEALNSSGVIITNYYVKTYANGLKVGVIGLMGKTADAYAPNAPPVTFKSDYANADVKAFIQGKVDALRNTEGVHVVIALSHSGVMDPNGTPAGDDMILAQNITGIDIIASGHDHEMTNTVIPVVNGSHTSYIICAGANGTNLAQLDFRVNMTQKKLDEAPTLTNHPINDTTAGSILINSMVQDMNDTINAILALPPLNTSLSTIVATSSINLNAPGRAEEFALGNLLADSIRYVGTEDGVRTIGAFANGVIRGTFTQGQEIAFADLFAIVPLGITTDDTQSPLLPGYPLLKVYLNGNEVWDLCKFDATIMAYQLYTSYFSSLSGLKCTYSGTTVTRAGHYEWNDYQCTGSTTWIDEDTDPLYPVIIDKYTMDMLLTPSIQGLLSVLGISLEPKLADGTVINAGNLMDARLDRDPVTPGIQEYYAWSAALKFFTDPGGLNGFIPTVPYDFVSPSTRRLVAE